MFQIPISELEADLNSPEISFDLQQFITTELAAQQAAAAAALSGNNGNVLNGHCLNNSQVAVVAAALSLGSSDDSVSFFTDLLNEKTGSNQQSRINFNGQNQIGNSNGNSICSSSSNSPVNSSPNSFNSYTIQNKIGTERYSNLDLDIKREQSELESNCQKSFANDNFYNTSNSNANNNFGSAVNNGSLSTHHIQGLNHQQSQQFTGGNPGLITTNSGNNGNGGERKLMKSSKHSKKNADKGTDEYKKRRERNNIAVRKSREKAKIRSRDTERKVSDLLKDNDGLRKKVETLDNQLMVLKTLLTNVGVPLESVENEIARNSF